MRFFWRITFASIFGVLLLHPAWLWADALEKLKAEKLKATHDAVVNLKAQRQEPPRTGPWRDVRANLHVHSAFSHDSRGKIEDIVASAKACGTHVLLFTEHPSDKYDYFKDGHRGLRDGVLLIPGAESNGFLVFPTQSTRGASPGSPQEFCDLVRGRDGLMFLSHLEERMNWSIRGLTGVEIYNTHADFKDEAKLISAMKTPTWLIGAFDLIDQYPQEAFSALQNYPKDYLRRWDELCATAPHTGVAANDSHQNVGLTGTLAENDKVRFEDALGKKLFELPIGLLPSLKAKQKDKKPGDVLFQARLDRYEHSLRHVGTHLLLPELSEKEVRSALEAGRAYVAFDWICDATGFDFAAHASGARHEMGSRIAFAKGMELRAQAALPVHWKLVRDGKTIQESDGRSFKTDVSQPGNYRIEAWLSVAGEDMIWILSNPIYVRRDGGK